MEMVEVLKAIWVVVGSIFGITLIFAMLSAFIEILFGKKKKEKEISELLKLLAFVTFLEETQKKSEENDDNKQDEKED